MERENRNDPSAEEEEEDRRRNLFYDGTKELCAIQTRSNAYLPMSLHVGQCTDGELWVEKIANFHTKLETAGPSLRFLPKLSKEIKQLQARAIQVATSINKEEKKRLKKRDPTDDDTVHSSNPRFLFFFFVFL